MLGMIRSYTRWLHTRWPAGTVEKLPLVNDDGSTNVSGLFVTGDLTGIPLLKFSVDTGARVVRTITTDSAFKNRTQSDAVHDIIVIGAGVSGVAAMAEALEADLDAVLLESAEALSTIENFPRRKPIYTYPTEMTPAGSLQFTDRSDVKEGLLEELRDFMRERKIEPRAAHATHVTRSGGVLSVHIEGDSGPVQAHRVIVAIGRSGNYRTLDIPGENKPHVSNRLHDPREFSDQNVIVVGGGDSALETAIALVKAGGNVTLSYRKDEFNRPKPENARQLRELEGNGLAVEFGSALTAIHDDAVEMKVDGGSIKTIPAESVFTMIGREAPLDFFRKSNVRIAGEWRPITWITCIFSVLFCIWLYHWKTDNGLPVYNWFSANDWFPFNLIAPENKANLFGTIRTSMTSPSFYYSLAYCLCVVVFGVKRIRRRKTPYVTRQTVTLALIQCIPLFLLPYILLPWMGHNGAFDAGVGQWFADHFFPVSDWDPQGREYWRSVGFILAWPLMFWNVFTQQPMMAWLIVSFMQTFVVIPFIVWKWGKGAYCGWICSCGALAETMGDAHRHKMPHGPIWNRVNMIGQVFLWIAVILLFIRIVGWITPGAGDWIDGTFWTAFKGKDATQQDIGGMMRYVNFAWIDDLLWAGILGVCFYFWFSGRVWCRFACPLAALMHIYARFSKFRIIADKKKCISCNVCTSVCHQGIDVMNFANKGAPMEDPECVRCSACVQSCPTGVLQFGEIDRKTGAVVRVDALPASPVLMAELTVSAKSAR